MVCCDLIKKGHASGSGDCGKVVVKRGSNSGIAGGAELTIEAWQAQIYYNFELVP